MPEFNEQNKIVESIVELGQSLIGLRFYTKSYEKDPSPEIRLEIERIKKAIKQQISDFGGLQALKNLIFNIGTGSIHFDIETYDLSWLDEVDKE